MLSYQAPINGARHSGRALGVLVSIAVLAAGLAASPVAAAPAQSTTTSTTKPAPAAAAPAAPGNLAPSGVVDVPVPADAPPPPSGPAAAVKAPAPPPSGTSSLVLPTDPNDPVAVALAQAQRTGKRVQITAQDTQTTTTWANPDGTMTTDVAAGPVRVHQGTGFVPIDPTLVVQAGAVVPKAATGDLRLSAGGATADLAAVGAAGSRMGLRWPGSLPAPTLAGDTATYHDVIAGGDLVVKALPAGYEVSLVLRSRPATAPVLRLPLSLDGLSLAQDTTGRLSLTDAAGKEVASSSPPVMTSAARDPKADEPTQTSVIPTSVETVNGVAQLVLRPDPAFLADPATAYPVTIDPDGVLGTSLSNYVASDYPNQNYDGEPLLKVGTYNGGATKDRSFIRFDDGVIKGTTVSSATLNLYETWAYSCSATQMYVEGASVFGAGTTWNTQPGTDGHVWNSDSFARGYTGCAQGPGTVNLNITGLVQSWQSGSGPNDAVALIAPDESNSYQWKKFASVNSSTPPTISVTYAPPSAPSAPQSVAAVAGNAQATVTWSAPANATGLDGYGVFNFYWNGSAWVQVSSFGTSPTTTSATLTGLANGVTYAVNVFSHSSVGWGGFAGALYIPSGPPSVVQNEVAGGGNASGTLRWVAPASNGGVPETYYLVGAYDSTNLSATVTQFWVCGTCTSAAIGGLTNGRAYYMAAWGYNPAGGFGPGVLSNIVSTTAADPMAGAGEQPFFTSDTYALSDRTTAKVNVGTGNLEVATTDLVVPTAGGSLALGRTFNSMAFAAGASTDYSGQFGYGWASNQTPDARLVMNPDPGRVELVSPSGGNQVFTGTAGAASTAYTAPAGADATLARNGSDGSYTLTGHASAEVLRFQADGQLLSDTDRNGNALNLAYPDGRRPAAITGSAGTAPGNTVTYTYNGPNGLVSSMAQTADGATRTVSFAYYSNQQLYQVTDAAGGVTTFAYGANSSLSQITGPAPLSAVTKFTYDNVARVTSVARAVPGSPDAVTTYDYSVPSHTKVTDADGHPPVDYTLDATGRVTAATDAKGKATSTTYTADAKVGSVINASAGTTTNTFGANGGESLTQSQGPTGATVTATYAAPGQPYLPSTVTDTMGKASTFTYSGPGNLASSANALAATASLTYNADGTVATATDPGGGVTNYAYNGAHQLVTVTPPAPLGAQSFTYDGAGRTKTATSAGMTTTYAYDALDRDTAETHSDSTPALSYGYDANGNLTSRTDASGTTGFAYDAANHLTSKTLPGGAVLRYGYDAAGNLISATDAGGAVTTYHYDKANLMDQITEPGGRTDVFAYDPDHRRTDTWDATGSPVTYDASGNNVVPPTAFAAHIHSSFNNAGQLTGLTTTRASSDANANRVGDLTYTYVTGSSCAGTTAGRVTSLRQTMADNLAGNTTTYCYDGGGRLLSATTSGGPTYTYAYDANGNRTSGPEGSHTFNSVNEATDASSVYDTTGNLTASTALPAAAYNKLNQATSITASGQSALALAYAGTTNAERTAAGATTYQNGLLGVEAQTTAGTTTSFVRDPQGGLVAEKIGTNEYYYAFDGIGSVIALIDASGTQRAAYSFDSYGGHATATAMNGTLPDNPWRYAGGALDSTGLYHFGARYYDPALGRWTQQDSVVSLGDPANGNRYAYAGDDPANFLDPSGKDFFGPVFDTENAFKVIRKAVKGKRLQGKEFLGDLVDTGTGIIVTTGCEATFGASTAELGGIGAAAGSGVCATLGAGAGRLAGHAIDSSNGVK